VTRFIALLVAALAAAMSSRSVGIRAAGAAPGFEDITE
jgi:hypothetical protein